MDILIPLFSIDLVEKLLDGLTFRVGHFLLEKSEHFDFAAALLQFLLVGSENFVDGGCKLLSCRFLSDVASVSECLDIECLPLLLIFLEVLNDEIEMAVVVNSSLAYQFREHSPVLFDDSRQFAGHSEQQVSHLLLSFGESALLDDFLEDLGTRFVLQKVADGALLKLKICT